MALRLAVGEVTVLLGSSPARRRVMNWLDDDSGRCAGGHDAVGVLRLTGHPDDGLLERRSALHDAGCGQASIVLVDRLTDGLSAAERRTLLADVREVAAGGRAVLVDDVDPVAALAVADGALRADPTGGLEPVAVRDPDYLAS